MFLVIEVDTPYVVKTFYLLGYTLDKGVSSGTTPFRERKEDYSLSSFFPQRLIILFTDSERSVDFSNHSPKLNVTL